MRHKKAGRQFGRDTSSRRAMLRNLTANLITHERIETTDAKAKELRRIAERLITRAKRIGEDLTKDTASLADTYNLANSTPNIVYELILGGILTSVFVPVFVDRMKTRGWDDAREVADRVMTLTLLPSRFGV